MLTALLLLLFQTQGLPAARPCSADETTALTAASGEPFRLTCRASLNGRSINRPVLIEGAEGSGAGIDCGGGFIGPASAARTTQSPTVAIWSRRLDGPAWSRPTDVTLTNCTVNGNLRIWGMGALGRQDDLLASSRTAGHTAAAQAAAPTRIALNGVSFQGTGSIPLYLGPGVTNVSLTGGRFGGRSDSTAVYLDAETAEASIIGVSFDIVTPREQIAVDGSARNRITGNRFVLRGQGGVFLYRNCGEDGVIRHQTPSNNIISDNVFSGSTRRSVVVGSREGGRRYCKDDRGWPFGSSIDDGDHATGNVVARNRTTR
ncbi:right-handed parallel beta-helix repeat-containing protein [soil metagenome]